MLTPSIAVFRAVFSPFLLSLRRGSTRGKQIVTLYDLHTLPLHFTAFGTKSGAPLFIACLARCGLRWEPCCTFFFFFYCRKNYPAFRMIPSCTDSTPFSCLHNAVRLRGSADPACGRALKSGTFRASRYMPDAHARASRDSYVTFCLPTRSRSVQTRSRSAAAATITTPRESFAPFSQKHGRCKRADSFKTCLRRDPVATARAFLFFSLPLFLPSSLYFILPQRFRASCLRGGPLRQTPASCGGLTPVWCRITGAVKARL